MKPHQYFENILKHKRYIYQQRDCVNDSKPSNSISNNRSYKTYNNTI